MNWRFPLSLTAAFALTLSLASHALARDAVSCGTGGKTHDLSGEIIALGEFDTFDQALAHAADATWVGQEFNQFRLAEVTDYCWADCEDFEDPVCLRTKHWNWGNNPMAGVRKVGTVWQVVAVLGTPTTWAISCSGCYERDAEG